MNHDRTVAENYLERVLAQYSRYQEPSALSKLDINDPEDRPKLRALLEETHGKNAQWLFDLLEKRAAQSGDPAQPGITTSSKYQDPLLFRLLNRLYSDIRDVAEEAGIDLPTHILFGTLPTGQVNACASPVPASQYRLILLDSGLFGFANLFSKALVSCFGLESKDGRLRFSFDCDPADIERASVRLTDLLLAYIVTGNPHNAEPYMIDRQRTGLAILLTYGVENFVMSHELGHCMAGHFEGDPGTRNIRGDGQNTLQDFEKSWVQEFEADIIGFNLSLRAMLKSEKQLPLAYLPLEIFFHMAEMIEAAASLLIFGEIRERAEGGTHPPSPQRAAVLREALSNSVGTEQAEAAFALADTVTGVIEQMFSASAPRLLAAWKDGIQVSPEWRQG